MPSVTIDAGVLAAPNPDASREAVLQYVDTLLDWKKLLTEPWVAIYMSERAADMLIEDGLYPLRNSLKQAFAARGIVEYDANTIAKTAEALLMLTPHFETVFRVKDVLWDDLSTEPDLMSISATQHLTSDLARCALLIALLRNHCHRPILDHALVVKPWNGKTVVQIQALVHDFDHERDDIDILPHPPEYVIGSVWVCQNFHELVSSLDEVAIWQAASDDAGLMVAVHIALYKARMLRGEEPEWGSGPSCRFGRNFAATTHACFHNNPLSLIKSTLRSIVETLDGLNLRAVHALRAGEGGDSPQRLRNQDKAWRRDIDYTYHLHFWECKHGPIEFADMVVHNDMSITY